MSFAIDLGFLTRNHRKPIAVILVLLMVVLALAFSLSSLSDLTTRPLQSAPAASDLRPASIDYLRSVIGETEAGWQQYSTQFNNSEAPLSLVLANSAPESRVFLNGILVVPAASSSTPVQVVDLPPGFLHSGRNRLDIIAQGGSLVPRPLVLLAPEQRIDHLVIPYLNFQHWLHQLTGLIALITCAWLLGRLTITGSTESLVTSLTASGVTAIMLPPLLTGDAGLAFSLQAGSLVLGLAMVAAALALTWQRSRLVIEILLPTLFLMAELILALSRVSAAPLAVWPSLVEAIGLLAGLALVIPVLAKEAASIARISARFVLSLGQREILIREQQTMIEQQERSLENEIRKRAVLEERARFAREMHDGLGSAILSLLVQVRGGSATADTIETALETNLEDIRLMIDSLDHSDRSLGAALSTFQTRVRPMFEAAGIELIWHQPTGQDMPSLPPESILNVFRILQETATNIVRHSNGDSARFRIDWSRDRRQLELVVINNGGPGLDTAISRRSGTSGLANMARRVEAMGGAFEAGPSEDEWIIRVVVPF